jgi:hypothetical protein
MSLRMARLCSRSIGAWRCGSPAPVGAAATRRKAACSGVGSKDSGDGVFLHMG